MGDKGVVYPYVKRRQILQYDCIFCKSCAKNYYYYFIVPYLHWYEEQWLLILETSKVSDDSLLFGVLSVVGMALWSDVLMNIAQALNVTSKAINIC